MMSIAFSVFLAFVQHASAHFQLTYPQWRADSFNDALNYSQWTYPCAGVPFGVGNRTDWPIHGGAVQLDLHHPWEYVHINLGLGTIVTDSFNMTLTADATKVTGRGKFCLTYLPLPDDILEGLDGQNASIQVTNNAADGNTMYNCADITFRANAKVPEGACVNDTGMSAVVVTQPSPSVAPNATTPTASSSPTSTPNSAMGASAGGVAFAGLVGLAVSLLQV
ncbi:hypothetical protein M426DRAFT_266421 [Hypoxylon sp. CI-4A]|nr:hypothetical protein M426DRAFT_266421 [Hypoxylon sp. CI-4A]